MQGVQHDKHALRQILEKNFEDRSESEHEVLIQFLRKEMKDRSLNQCRWLSLLCSFFPDLSDEQKRQRLQIENSSIIICSNSDSDAEFSVRSIKKQLDLANLPNEGFVIIISKRNLSTSLAMCDASIEDAIRGLRSFEYLEDIPKKRFFHILRCLDVLQFTFGQIVYLENHLISEECSVYMVKDGDFTFLKRQKQTHKNVELCTFSEGYIFGTEEETEVETEEGQTVRRLKERRAFTVKCQSSKGTLYRVGLDFFNAFMRKSCETLLHSNNQRLNRFLAERFAKAEMNLTRNAQFITQPFKRSFSIQFPRSSQQLFSFNLQGKQQTKLLADEQAKKSTLPSLNLKAQFPSRKRLLSKDELKKLSPEYQQEKLIRMKQLKCEAIKEATKSSKTLLCKGEVLLNLMKTSYQFEKFRYKKNIY